VPIVWHPTLDALHDSRRVAVPAIIVANEWLDCTPRDQALKTSSGWLARSIAIDAGGHLAFASAATSLPLPSESIARVGAAFRGAGVGTIVEVGAYRAIPEIMKAHHQAAAIVIDYGHAAPVAGDTLQAVRDHCHEHPLTSPGEADLTMQVDFAQVRSDVLSIGGLATDGPVPQAEFLGNLGIVERASRLMASNAAKAAMLEAGVARLLAPSGMGTRFKALGIRSACLPPLPGFPMLGSRA
jgi:SAM-dependent MidA family methyltransferase